jgi:pimeloyl-ACP methyl ester carboxylesterase
VTKTPAGDAIDLSAIPRADGLLILAAHISRAKIFTEWIDPAVLDEADPTVREPSLDLWNPEIKPPYSAEFVARFRQAQIARNRRITQWAKNKLVALENDKASPFAQGRRDFPFVVRSTQADPRRLDVSLDPNGRQAATLLELAQENHSPVGLARFTTCRSWLSQWSYDESNADGPTSLLNVTVPTLVLANEADHLVPLTHPRAMFAQLKQVKKKKYVEMKGATHYYFGQHQLMNSAVREIKAFLHEAGLLKIDKEFAVVG